VLILAGVAVALIKDLPAMLLGISRLMFAWGEDGVFPPAVAQVHRTSRAPHVAILVTGLMATLSIIGCHLAGDFFLGVDILVTAMLANFFLMSLSVIALPITNPQLAARITVLPARLGQLAVALLGAIGLAGFFVIHTWRDLTGPAPWYFRSTNAWLIVMIVGSLLFLRETAGLARGGVDLVARFRELPPE
jgi:APA family basic amino acid/polyamine antiporter